MNPYAAHLGTDDPVAVIGKTAERLTKAIKAKGPEGVDRPLAPGKWSPRQVAAHLADCEAVFAFRIRQTLAEPHHVIQPFDQDLWAKPYSAYTVQEALAVFSAVRTWNLTLVRSLPAGAFDKPVTHPERGSMTLQTVIETMGGHDANHLSQIEGIATRDASA